MGAPKEDTRSLDSGSHNPSNVLVHPKLPQRHFSNCHACPKQCEDTFLDHGYVSPRASVFTRLQSQHVMRT